MHTAHAIGRFYYGGFTHACRVMAADYEVLGMQVAVATIFAFLFLHHVSSR